MTSLVFRWGLKILKKFISNPLTFYRNFEEIFQSAISSDIAFATRNKYCSHQSISRNSRFTSYIRESDLGKESFPPLKRFTGKKIARSANYSSKSIFNLIATLSIL